MNEARGPSRKIRCRAVGGVLAACFVFAAPSVAVTQTHADAQETDIESASLGADLDQLLRLAHRLNPEIAAMALEREAMAARAAAADSLPEPVFRTSFEDIERRGASLEPRRIGAILYSVSQEFPLWGKRDLRRSAALAEAKGAAGREQATALEVAARVKAAFAQHYQAVQSIQITEELRTLLDTLLKIAQARVGQGIGAPQESLRIDVEKVGLTTNLAVLERDRRAAQARLNALLDRPVGARLAPPAALRPVPAGEDVQLDALVKRAVTANPAIASTRAEIAAAEATRTLAQRAWYPDVTLGLTAVDRDRRLEGYEAMVEFKIPLRWGLREAEIREATARLGASGARLESTKAKLRNELEDAYWGFETTRRVEELLRTTMLPQAQAAYRAAFAGYQQGRADVTSVLETERRVREVRLDLVKTQTERQMLLAEIERLIGGDL